MPPLPTPFVTKAVRRGPRRPLSALLGGLLAAQALLLSPAWAEPPRWAQGRGQGHDAGQSWRDSDAQRGPARSGDERRADRRDDRRDNEGRDPRRDERRPARGAPVAQPAPLPSGIAYGAYFRPPQRTVVHDYYASEYRAGRCPPGLARKGNGCLPPGQAKKRWNVGQPLPASVVYYPVPQPVVLQLGAPPVGYEYVRVGLDVLLIATGTRMVIDGLQGLAGY